jgi:hypothetical protein
MANLSCDAGIPERLHRRGYGRMPRIVTDCVKFNV